MEPETDLEALVGMAAAGDRTAFDSIASGYRAWLRSFVERRLGEHLRSEVTVEDVVQETFLRALRGIEGFEWRGQPEFERWLQGIATHTILEVAGKRRRGRAIALDMDPPSADPSPSRVLRREERLERLKSAVQGLPPDYRTALTLARLEGLTVKEVAARMRRSPNAVSQLILRGLRRLRRTLGDTESLGLVHDPRQDGGTIDGR